MSLESKIEALTAAVAQLTAVMQAGKATVQQAAPVVQAPAPAPVAAPVVAAMPAPPTFAAPAPVAPTTSAAPFTDAQGLMQYVMAAYQAMGPAKGAQIQGILTHLGCTNINEVKPEQYGQLFAAVEQLKAS